MYWQAYKTKDHKKNKRDRRKGSLEQKRKERELLSNKNKFDFSLLLISAS